LESFLNHVKNRLDQIGKYLKDKIINSYNLDSKKQKFGIDRNDFQSNNKAIILSKSKCKDQFSCNLMEYKEKGHYYLYEDEKLIVYEETALTHLSSCFVRIKCKK